LVLFPFLTAVTGSGDGKQQDGVSKMREKLGSEPMWYWGEVHDGLAADSGEDGWQADSRICVVLLRVTYRLIGGKDNGLDVTLGYNCKSKVCRKATGNIYDLDGTESTYKWCHVSCRIMSRSRC
jgi:hypothetical protein